MLFVEVILPLPLRQLYTYSVPTELEQQVVQGMRVVVQFGAKRFYTAIIRHLRSTPPQHETKEIISCMDSIPLVTEQQLKLWDWIAEYYLCPTGEVMKASLPAALKLESETYLFFNENFDQLSSLSDDELQITQLVKEKQKIQIDEIFKKFKKKNALIIIKQLSDKQVIYINEAIKERYKPKTESIILISGDLKSPQFVNDTYEALHRSPKQLDLFMTYLNMFNLLSKSGEPILITRKKLLSATGASSTALTSLIEKGIFLQANSEISRLAKGEYIEKEIATLNTHQQQALNDIHQQFEQKSVCLLHGVTSSGKTEIYIHLIAKQITNNKQVLYLLPEIALTGQIINRLKAVFGNRVGIYHSKCSDAERVEIWHRVLSNSSDDSYQVIVGVRSSVLLPFSNLGLIIVDEEHESTFKQFDPAPRYHARDVAIILAHHHAAKVLLGSATPSIESYANATQGKYGLIQLLTRHKDIALPAIQIIDTRQTTKQGGMHSLFSKQLLEAIDSALKNNEQVILFQNKRGFSPYIQCSICGNIPRCKYCDVSLTYHKFSNSLQCHYCGYTQRNEKSCIACGSNDLLAKGFGTEKIEDELSLLLPSAKIARFDHDSTRGKEGHTRLINEFESREIDILIGTQMISKGLDFENVSLVGILDADSLLNYPNFRAYERSFQLMTQVAGRAGRSNKQGQVIIQTAAPLNPIITYVVNNNYQAMYAEQMSERHAFKYPPYFRLIQLSIRHKDKEICELAAQYLATLLQQQFGSRILGPEAPPVPRIQNKFIMHILCKIERDKSPMQAKSLIFGNIDLLKSQPDFKQVEVFADIDPY